MMRSYPRSGTVTVPKEWGRFDEARKVLEWRTAVLVRAGATDLLAAALATTSNDLHVMERALLSGMSHDQAEKVFL